MKFVSISLFALLSVAHGFSPKATTRVNTQLDVAAPGGFGDYGYKPGYVGKKVALPPTKKEVGKKHNGDVMLTHKYDWPLALAAHVPLFPFIYPSPVGILAAGFHAILAALTWSQTNRVRLVMGKDSFELFNLSNSGTFLKEKPSNYVKGTANKWYYKDITDLAFWPSQQYPFIVYFKETATATDTDGNFEWWGKFAELHDPTANGNAYVPGQAHFMPGLFDVKEFVEELGKHGVKPRENYWWPHILPKNGLKK